MQRALAFAVPLVLMIPLAPVQAVETGMQMVIEFPGDAETRTIQYTCEETEEPRTVTYVNASPNFLAITEVDGERLIFSTTIAASGVRYVSGQYAWWTKGAEATLHDQMAEEDAPPLETCIEANDIP